VKGVGLQRRPELVIGKRPLDQRRHAYVGMRIEKRILPADHLRNTSRIRPNNRCPAAHCLKRRQPEYFTKEGKTKGSRVTIEAQPV
jgi:hypothetical protein